MASVALEARQILAQSAKSCGVILCEFISPYDELADAIIPLLPLGAKLLIAEEEIMRGGFAMNLSDALRRKGDKHTIITSSVMDDFVVPASGQTVFEAAGVDARSLVKLLS